MLAASVALPVALQTMPDSVQKVASPHLIIAMWLASVVGLVARPFKQFDRPAAVATANTPASGPVLQPLVQKVFQMSAVEDFEKSLLGAAESTLTNMAPPYGAAGAAIVSAISNPTTANRLSAARAFVVAIETALNTPVPTPATPAPAPVAESDSEPAT